MCIFPCCGRLKPTYFLKPTYLKETPCDSERLLSVSSDTPVPSVDSCSVDSCSVDSCRVGSCRLGTWSWRRKETRNTQMRHTVRTSYVHIPLPQKRFKALEVTASKPVSQSCLRRTNYPASAWLGKILGQGFTLLSFFLSGFDGSLREAGGRKETQLHWPGRTSSRPTRLGFLINLISLPAEPPPLKFPAWRR